MKSIEFILALLFLGGVTAFIIFPTVRLCKWLYRTIKAERRENYALACWRARLSLGLSFRAIRSFGWRKFILGLLIASILLVTLPITLDKADYAIRSTIIRKKMDVVIKNLEQYQGEEPWRACSTCPYETGTTFGWFVWDWAYEEMEFDKARLFLLVAFDVPSEVQEQIWVSLYYYPGLRQFPSDIERLFPEVKAYFPWTGPNLGPMVYRGKKYPVVPSDYMGLEIERGEYEWIELSQLQLDEAVQESAMLTLTLFWGPQVHRGFLGKQVVLLHWYQRVNWERVWTTFVRWITWPEN